ncbi:MAG: hypothetical protein ACLURW_11010 [Flavonifractor plautii]|jgi:hypothetical protein|nr:MAG TPA: hypothetical protein [Caudoviricetes sp.]
MMNIDDVISYYEGKVVRDRKRVLTASPISEGVPRAVYEKELKRHKLVLGALKCAKANGFTGEE